MRIKNDNTHTLVIEKSEFICYLHRASTEEEARSFIATIKKKHHSATHCCTAFVLGDNNEVQRCNDDGEPSGTAGIPMLGVLQKADIHDCCACVVRYFGGIKLGAGGLIRAYSKSVSETLQLTPKVKFISMNIYQCSFNYDLIGKVDHALTNLGDAQNKSYDLSVSYTIQTNHPNFVEEFIEKTQGKVDIHFLEKTIVEKELSFDSSSEEN